MVASPMKNLAGLSIPIKLIEVVIVGDDLKMPAMPAGSHRIQHRWPAGRYRVTVNEAGGEEKFL